MKDWVICIPHFGVFQISGRFVQIHHIVRAGDISRRARPGSDLSASSRPCHKSGGSLRTDLR